MTDLVRRLLGQESRKPRWVIPGRQGTAPAEVPRPRGRFRRSMLANLPFLAGLAMVGTLVLVTILAPVLAPHNPYAVSVDLRYLAEMGAPPYAPSGLFPLGTDRFGRDILSMLLYGASTTLIGAGAVTIARLFIGLTLGAIAGWFQNGLVDGVIMSMARFLSAFPILLVGMILILALDIRQGLQVFVVALAFVGWSELAQYIRAEFMTLKQQPFIESARAVGLSGFGIAVRHVLPNVLPSLIALSALEMGGVLMLLGELGFLSIFIGGGAYTIEVPASSMELERVVHYANVPEWGAMLAGTRLYARTYPWLALVPATAFFFAIVGFNLLGEGFRRIIEESGVNIALLISKRTLVGIGLVVVAMWFVHENTGPLTSYALQSDQFDASAVIAETRMLTTGDMAVRPPGSPGATAAAEYIAQQFQQAGLQPWGDNWETYFQHVEFEVAELGETPRLATLNPDGSVAHEFVYRQDFRERLFRASSGGSIKAAGVTFVGLNPQRPWDIDAWQGRNDNQPPVIGQDVVMVLQENEPINLTFLLRRSRAARQPVPGLLVVTSDLNRIQQQGDAPVSASMGTTLLAFELYQPTPTCYISEQAADRLLASQGLTVAGLRERLAAMSWDAKDDVGEPFIVEQLPISITMSVQVTPPRTLTATNVIGFMPGTDTELDAEMVVVAAHYDGLPTPPDAVAPPPGAVDNAASIATLLEIARLWQEQGFQPRRTIVFLAVPGGETSLKALERFKSYHTVFQTLTPVAFVQVDSIAGGTGDGLVVTDADFRLHSLVSQAAGKLGIGVALEHPDFGEGAYGSAPKGARLGEYANRIGPVHRYFTLPLQNVQVPAIALRWEGSDDVIHRSTDTVEALNPDIVSRAGRVLDLMLRVLARETAY
ncbi:MAG: M28 family peptidase [Chloroflexi bacterium]|nr:M28 family peptidase [Chloroflexota bacterium]MBU1747466.1 M28 family peptidase [Chloroflexota bacterium]